MFTISDPLDDLQILEQLFRVTVLLGQSMQRELSDRGLTLARARLLWRLVQHGPATHRALADALRVTPRNVTGLVDRLEADGHVVRQPHPSDRRASIVTLTDSGMHATAAMQGDARTLAQRLTGDLPQRQRETLSTRLDEIIAGLTDILAVHDQPDSDSGQDEPADSDHG